MTNQKVVKKHDLEYRMDAAKMVVEGGRTTKEVAEDIGTHYQTISYWVKAYKKSKTAEVLSPMDLKLKAALEDNRKLKVQVEFLKKTMAYFVELPK